MILAVLALAGCNAISGLGGFEVVVEQSSASGGATGGGGAAVSSSAGGSSTTSTTGGGGSAPMPCENGMQDPGELLVDCGGACEPCPCTVHADCPSEACLGGSCAEVVQIDAGTRSTCAVLADGTAHCWGDNNWGMLGDGTMEYRSAPVPVIGGLSFVTLGAGSEHTCGLTTAGEVYCWGRNRAGQLGDGPGTDQSSPVPIFGGLTFVTLDIWGDENCGLTAAGEAYCWGGASRTHSERVAASWLYQLLNVNLALTEVVTCLNVRQYRGDFVGLFELDISHAEAHGVSSGRVV